jgi:uncharacterized YccA/Bax inhibitor family protein
MANPALEKIYHDAGGYPKSPSAYGIQSLKDVVTLDKVIEKAALCLGVVVGLAVVTYIYILSLMGDFSAVSQGKFQTILMATGIASLAAVGLSFWISFSQRIRPLVILLFSAIEGVVLGVFTATATVGVGGDGLALAAVGATFITASAVLFVYKLFNIKVGERFHKMVFIAVLAFVGVSLFDFVLYFFGKDFGLNGFGFTGFIFSLLGLTIALFMLISDFDMIERAIAAQLPAEYSWKLGWSLLVTLIWIYVNILKILRYMRR